MLLLILSVQIAQGHWTIFSWGYLAQCKILYENYKIKWQRIHPNCLVWVYNYHFWGKYATQHWIAIAAKLLINWVGPNPNSGCGKLRNHWCAKYHHGSQTRRENKIISNRQESHGEAKIKSKPAKSQMEHEMTLAMDWASHGHIKAEAIIWIALTCWLHSRYNRFKLFCLRWLPGPAPLR